MNYDLTMEFPIVMDSFDAKFEETEIPMICLWDSPRS